MSRGSVRGVESKLMKQGLLRLAWLILCAPVTVFAHIEQGDVQGGFISGVLHPVLGLDHLVAMVAVGIWGAQLGRPAIWVLPITFPLVMAIGGVLGAMKVALPGVEIGVAASAIILGAMIAFVARPPLPVAGVIVALFAIFHGYAHGAELPANANAIAYSTGFVLATGTLHCLGIVIGEIKRWPPGAGLLRVAGALILLIGFWFLLPHLSGA